MSAAIEFRNVSFAVSRERLLLDNISLTLEEGTTTAILGRSGSGKTTLLRTVNRLIEPTGGNVSYMTMEERISRATARNSFRSGSPAHGPAHLA